MVDFIAAFESYHPVTRQFEFMTKRKSFIVLALIAAAAIAPFAKTITASTTHKWRAHLALQAAVSNTFPGVTAYQVETLNYTLPPKPNVQPTDTRTVAVAPDGSHAEIQTMLATGEVKRTIVTPTRKYWTWDHLNAKTSVARPPGAGDLRITMDNPSADCVSSYLGDKDPSLAKVGEETLLGWKAVKMVTSADDRRLTIWKIPALGCLTAQIFMESFEPNRPSVVMSTTLLETTKIIVGPPAANLFVPPANDAEHSFREASRLTMEFFARRSGRFATEADVQKAVEQKMSKLGPNDVELERRYQLRKVTE
jgi:hypothetical protein